jgi:hypothetical protein
MKTSIPDGDNVQASLACTAVSELVAVREDLAETKAAFLRYFRRGVKCGLTLRQLMDLLPRVFGAVEYPLEQGRCVLSMLESLTPREIGAASAGFGDSGEESRVDPEKA